MAVLRIVANLETPDPPALAAFYQRLFDLDKVMDFGWISTLATPSKAAVQLSFASQGGAGTAVPSLSIEVDDLSEIHTRALRMGIPIEYGPVLESWGVERFYIRDPNGTLLNILIHADSAT